MTTDDIVTGGRPVCYYCHAPLIEVQDPYSFTMDYEIDGDFGCSDHPDNDDEGTYGHSPAWIAR